MEYVALKTILNKVDVSSSYCLHLGGSYGFNILSLIILIGRLCALPRNSILSDDTQIDSLSIAMCYESRCRVYAFSGAVVLHYCMSKKPSLLLFALQVLDICHCKDSWLLMLFLYCL